MTVNNSTTCALAAHTDLDIILVGGGLANSLIAWRLMSKRPQLRLLVIERGATLGGNHTWSFHQGDVTAAALSEMAPFIAASWPTQSVHFPAHSRVFDVAYHAISSDRLHEVLSLALGDRLVLNTEVATLEPTRVVLADGQIILDRDMREQFRGHPHFEYCAQFCHLYDQNSFEPHYDTLPLVAFEPMLRRVVAKPKTSIYSRGG